MKMIIDFNELIDIVKTESEKYKSDVFIWIGVDNLKDSWAVDTDRNSLGDIEPTFVYHHQKD